MSYDVKKILYVFTIALFCASLLSPLSARAQVAVPVVEVGPLLENTVKIMISQDNAAWNSAQLAAKETGLGYYNGVPVTGAQVLATAGVSADSLSTRIVKDIIQQFTGSIVNWINSGFQGGPAFITNPETFFINVADRAAGMFIESTALGFACDPFQLRLALNLNYSASFRDKIQCTLTQVIDNTENFYNDFSQGGWAGWFSVTQNMQNNPYGSYYLAQVELNKRVADAVRVKQEDLQQSGGILSWRDCLQEDYTDGHCVLEGPVKTPGKVIVGQLDQALGSNLQQLELAKEFDEILTALLGQLTKQVIMEANGLRGA